MRVPRGGEDGEGRIWRRRHLLVRGGGRGSVQVARLGDVEIGVGGGGVASGSDFACAGIVFVDDDDDDGFERAVAGIVKMKSVMNREEKAI